MKYLIPFVLVLALVGCENNPGGSENSAGAAPEKNASYLDKPIKAAVNQRGLYKLLRSGGIIDDPTTSTGKAVSKPVIQLVKSTERIPLIKGAQMYLQYRIWYLPDQPAYIDLRRVLKHPAMTLPDGSVATGSDYTLKGRVSVNQAIGYTGYGLDEDYELVEGEWVFEIWYQNKKLVEQKFTTYWPDKDELVELETSLGPNKNLRVMNSPGNKPATKSDWPRISIDIGEDPVPASEPSKAEGQI